MWRTKTLVPGSIVNSFPSSQSPTSLAFMRLVPGADRVVRHICIRCIRCVVKGYHECPFKVNIGETFYAFKKRGERRFSYGSLYYGVVTLPDIPSKCSECCRVPCVCYSESTLHFPFNYYSVIFPFGCTGECSRCIFFCYIQAAYKLFVLVTL